MAETYLGYDVKEESHYWYKVPFNLYRRMDVHIIDLGRGSAANRTLTDMLVY